MSDMITYLPDILHGIREYKALFDVDAEEVSKYGIAADQVLGNQFIATADTDGLSRYESMFEITPKITATLADRRFEILTKINESAPYTLESLLEKLKALCGDDGYSATLNAATYTLTVRVDLGVKNQYGSVEAFLERIVPANILVDLSLKYNIHSMLAEYTHADLSSYTHQQLREEVFE